MADYPCDGECGLPAAMSVTSFADGAVQFFCVRCMGTFGMVLMREIDPESFADMARTGLEAEPAPKPKRGKAKTAELDESARTIATITEDRPTDLAGNALPDGDPVPVE